jgi:coenzyme F420-reducing hydrogenase beta subunit
MESSSGGLFSLLAEHILNSGGTVFGACFNDKLEVVHSFAESLDDLRKIRGSKYVQSKIGDSFSKAKELLKQDRQVLFSGTPCQIAGLRNYLGEDFDNLLCIDVVCHGVPSPLVFRKYIEELERKHNDKIASYNFRDKKNGWKKFSNTVKFKSGMSISTCFHEDIYMQGFLKNIYLRPACYKCQNKYPNCKSDITVEDYWGIETKFSEIDDDNGVSLILTNSSKGEEMLKLLKDKMDIVESNIEHSITYNPSAANSVKPHRNRHKFFKEFNIKINYTLVKFTILQIDKVIRCLTIKVCKMSYIIPLIIIMFK